MSRAASWPTPLLFLAMACRQLKAFKLAWPPTQEAVEANNQSRERIGANEQQIASNQQEIQDVSPRFSDLSEFDTKGEATIFFASGSKKIPARDQTALGSGSPELDLRTSSLKDANSLVKRRLSFITVAWPGK